jgi:hypothetical protein
MDIFQNESELQVYIKTGKEWVKNLLPKAGEVSSSNNGRFT